MLDWLSRLMEQKVVMTLRPAVLSRVHCEMVDVRQEARPLPEMLTPAGFRVQAPSTNRGSVFLGGEAEGCHYELRPGQSELFPNLVSPEWLWVSGPEGDSIVVLAEGPE